MIGCSKQQNLEYSSKEYPGVNKDALLNAAKTVIKLSDSTFAIDSKRTSIHATKISPIHKGFTVDINVNTIEMMVFPDENITRAKVKFVHKNNILAKNEEVVYGDTHTLFWNRVDYILGLKDKWSTCFEHRINLNFDGMLCDIVHNENNTPTKNDIITKTGFDFEPQIKEKTVVLADINLTSMKEVILPLEFNELNSSNESNISYQDELNISIEPIETNESLEIIDINQSDENITEINTTLLDLNNSDINVSIMEDNKEDILTDETNITLQESNITVENNQSLESNISIENNQSIDTTITKPKEDAVSYPELSPFAQKFMAADPMEYYTINLALFFSMENAIAYTQSNNIFDESFLVEFQIDDKNYVKVVYGLYPSLSQAKEALGNLPLALKKTGPTTEGVKRKQVLYITKDIEQSKKAYQK
jgi:hypothetical protein